MKMKLFFRSLTDVTSGKSFKGKRSEYTCYSAAYVSRLWTAALHNLGSGSWLAWANGTAAHYAATRCSQQRTLDPRCSTTDLPHGHHHFSCAFVIW